MAEDIEDKENQDQNKPKSQKGIEESYLAWREENRDRLQAEYAAKRSKNAYDSSSKKSKSKADDVLERALETRSDVSQMDAYEESVHGPEIEEIDDTPEYDPTTFPSFMDASGTSLDEEQIAVMEGLQKQVEELMGKVADLDSEYREKFFEDRERQNITAQANLEGGEERSRWAALREDPDYLFLKNFKAANPNDLNSHAYMLAAARKARKLAGDLHNEGQGLRSWLPESMQLATEFTEIANKLQESADMLRTIEPPEMPELAEGEVYNAATVPIPTDKMDVAIDAMAEGQSFKKLVDNHLAQLDPQHADAFYDKYPQFINPSPDDVFKHTMCNMDDAKHVSAQLMNMSSGLEEVIVNEQREIQWMRDNLAKEPEGSSRIPEMERAIEKRQAEVDKTVAQTQRIIEGIDATVDKLKGSLEKEWNCTTGARDRFKPKQPAITVDPGPGITVDPKQLYEFCKGAVQEMAPESAIRAKFGRQIVDTLSVGAVGRNRKTKWWNLTSESRHTKLQVYDTDQQGKRQGDCLGSVKFNTNGAGTKINMQMPDKNSTHPAMLKAAAAPLIKMAQNGYTIKIDAAKGGKKLDYQIAQIGTYLLNGGDPSKIKVTSGNPEAFMKAAKDFAANSKNQINHSMSNAPEAPEQKAAVANK